MWQDIWNCAGRTPAAGTQSANGGCAGHLLALHVTAAREQDRTQIEQLAEQVQQIARHHVDLAYVDHGSKLSNIL